MHSLLFRNKQDRESTLKAVTANMSLEDLGKYDIKKRDQMLTVDLPKETK